MRWAFAVAAALAGCGRVAFDALPDTSTGPCLVDDFNDGDASDWTVIDPDWSIMPGYGPDGSTAFGTPVVSDSESVVHTRLYGVRSAHVSVDFRIDNGINGDFDVFLVVPGWTNPEAAGALHYMIGMYPNGSDDTVDVIERRDNISMFDRLVSRPTTIEARTWHHLDVDYDPTGTIAVALDTMPYLTVIDTVLAPPLDIALRFYLDGAIDNVAVDCTR